MARLIVVGVDELLAERHMSSRVCPYCGRPPDDFVDEETVVADRTPSDGLAVLDVGDFRLVLDAALAVPARHYVGAPPGRRDHRELDPGVAVRVA